MLASHLPFLNYLLFYLFNTYLHTLTKHVKVATVHQLTYSRYSDSVKLLTVPGQVVAVHPK